MGINLFSYKNGNGLFYIIPAWIKILLLILSSVFFFFLDIKGCVLGIFVLTILFRLQKFCFIELLKDLKPVFIFILFLYLVSITNNLYENNFNEKDFYKIFYLNMETSKLIVRLIATVLVSSLIFRTTTFLQLQTGITMIEKKLKLRTKTAYNIILVICFIPIVFQTWNNLDLAWKNRGGKNGIKKIYVLIPALLSLCMENASKKAKAIQSRYFMPCVNE